MYILQKFNTFPKRPIGENRVIDFVVSDILIPVSIGPGAIVTTLIPCLPRDLAIGIVAPIIAPFEDAYENCSFVPYIPAMLATLIITPPFCDLAIIDAPCFETRYDPKKLIFMILSSF